MFDSMKRMSRRRKAILTGVLIGIVLAVIFLVPFVPATVPGGVATQNVPALVHYQTSIGYKLFGIGISYWEGKFYCGSLPPIP